MQIPVHLRCATEGYLEDYREEEEMKKQRWEENRDMINENKEAIEQIEFSELVDDYDALKKLVLAMQNTQAILVKQLQLAGVGFRRPGQINNAIKETQELKKAIKD
jgi:hypothetical protein